MRVLTLRWWAPVVVALLTAGILPKAVCAQNQAGQSSLAAEEQETCTRNLRIIYDAIQAYQYDHKDLPNWLSDLVPDYLSDPNVLICPVCRRTGKTEAPPLADPKVACSYVFEFSPVPVGAASPGGLRHTRREWKRRQMGLVGSAVPIVRCRNHDPVLNLGFNGTVYGSPPQWELVFTNRVNPAELSLRSIFGGEGAVEDAPTPVLNNNNTVRGSTSADPVIKSRSIDLTSFYNSPLDETWQGHPGDTLSSLPKGLQTFGGVAFDVRGLVQLQGQPSALAKYPVQIKGIPIHQRCQHLYFLHAASFGGNPNEGEQIGSYIVHLPNNPMSLEIPIYYGREVRNWHATAREPEPDKELKVVWTGDNAVSKRMGKPIRLFVTAWNLAPGVEIDSLDFVSAVKAAAPFLLAISVD
jgi:hypothetical protein